MIYNNVMARKSIKVLFVMLIAGFAAMNAGNPALKPYNLTLDEARQERVRLVEQWKTEQAERLRHNLDELCIRQNGLFMPFSYTVFGNEPEDGRSLWISLHGGGNAPKELNDSQWENQKRLYRPEEGIYLCPRAPWDDWNMWFQQPIDSMFEELIRTMVVLKNVNPDKVYILGYSAGGDGLWRLSPRLADHWAAASMMAGHPGDVSLVNVRNLPFMLWVGEKDDAYNRNTEVAKRGLELDSLHRADPDGYVHECHVVHGKGHWMDLEDAAALPWMAAHVRSSYPKRIVWRQEEVLHQSFYWLEAPSDELERGRQVVVSVKGNRIDIERCDYSSLTLYLNDSIVNLDKPVKIRFNGKTVKKGRFHRNIGTLRETLYARGDPSYMFDCKVVLNF